MVPDHKSIGPATLNAFLTLYRSFSRHTRFALINLGGLALGIAVFLLLFLFVRFETSFDRTLPGWDKIWIVQRSLQFGGAPPVDIPSRVDMLPLLTSDYPETEGARLVAGNVAVQSGRQAIEERLALIDPAYFELFPLPQVSGSAMQTLARPDGAIVSQRIAERYLRPGDPIGQTLAVTIGEETRILQVGAVLRDLPAGMTHRNDIFIRLTPDTDTFFRGSDGTVTFLRFPDERAAEARIASLPAFNARHPDPSFGGPPDLLKVTERVIPLASLHLAEPRDGLMVATACTGLDSQGRVLWCAINDNQLMRLEPDGTRTVLAATGPGGKHLTGPNDIAVLADDTIFIATNQFGFRDGKIPEGFLENGVWRLKDGELSLALSAEDLGAPANGITVSPDEKYLYLSALFKLVRYTIQPDGTLTDRLELGEGEGIIDGMKVDTLGNIYSTSGAGPGVVRISAPDGKVLGYLRLPIDPSEPKRQICATNVAFGGPDNRTLFIAGCDALYAVDMKVAGIAQGPRS